MNHATENMPSTGGGCCGGQSVPSAQTAEAATTCAGQDRSAASAAHTAVCPVMKGATVVKTVAEATGLFRDYKGERYWFCCTACGPMFDADPDRYATAVA